MSMSGIQIDSECIKVFDDIKMEKKGLKRRKVAAFTISDDETKVVVDQSFMAKTSHFSRDQEHDRESFEDLKAILKNDYRQKPSYIFLDFNFINTKDNARNMERLAFIYWCPDACKVKEKMLFASTKDTVKKKFETNLAMQCADESDLDYVETINTLSKT